MELGTDPEFFILEKRTGNPVPAHRFLGDKHHKRNLDLAGQKGLTAYDTYGVNGKIFRDGYVVEVNTDPHYCRGVLLAAVSNALGSVQELIGPDHLIDTAPARKIDLADLQDAPPDLMSFGCDPAWNAYTLQESTSPLDASSWPIRYAGGHMHFGVNKAMAPKHILAHEENFPLLTKMMDLWIALPLAFLTSDPRTFERREFYGKAGEFRIQKYSKTTVGFEYRVPGADLYNHHFLVQIAFGVGRRIIETFGTLKEKWNPKIEPDLREAVNTGKGLEALLGTVPDFYTPEILGEARTKWKKEFRNFSLPIPNGNVLPGSSIPGYSGLPGMNFFQYSGWTNEIVHPSRGVLKHLLPKVVHNHAMGPLPVSA